MTSFENKEKEKEEFLSYLDQYGILDKITDVLILLYNEPEQPMDPIDFVRKNMHADNSDVREIATMELLLKTATDRLAKLRNVRDELKAKLQKLENEGFSSEVDEHEYTDDVEFEERPRENIKKAV